MAANKKVRKGRAPQAYTGIDMAIEKLGSQAELARVIGSTRQLVNHWKKLGKVPPAWALTIEQRVGIHRHYLNRDVYPEVPPEAFGLISGHPAPLGVDAPPVSAA